MISDLSQSGDFLTSGFTKLSKRSWNSATITITTFQKDEHAYIQFKDTGVGIPDEALARIFVPGYTTKDRGTSTGLGLSICHQIIRDHNGDILVESEVGRGTIFTVVLPMTVTPKHTDERSKGSEHP